MLVINEASIANILTIAAMWTAIDECDTQPPFGGNSDTSHQRAVEIITHAIDSPTACVLTAKSNDTLIGTITGHIYQRPGVKISSVGVIYGMWVEPDHRRQGIGQELLTFIERHLIMMGAAAFQVGWDVSNPIAGQWWQNRGYQPYETIASKMPD